MAKSKSVSSEGLLPIDTLAPRAGAFERIRRSLEILAEFYGFESMEPGPIEEVHTFAAASRAGVLEERPLLSTKLASGLEVYVAPPPFPAVLRAYSTHRMHELSHPLKFQVHGTELVVKSKASSPAILPYWSVVTIGEEGPVAEAEMVRIVWKSVEGFLGAEKNGLSVRANATGCHECRPIYRSSLNTYLRGRASRLCKNCKRSLKNSPARIFNCQEEKCLMVANTAPQILDFICEKCKKHLKGFLEFLEEFSIPYWFDHGLFREGSWYDTLVFEITSDRTNAKEGQESPKPFLAAEGGRLSRLNELIQGKRLPAAGCFVLLEELEGYLCGKGVLLSERPRPELFLVQLGELAKRKSFALLEMLRAEEMMVEQSFERDAIKSQLKVAERLGAPLALILGQKEALDRTVIVREMDSGIQETVGQDKLIDFLKKKLKNSSDANIRMY